MCARVCVCVCVRVPHSTHAQTRITMRGRGRWKSEGEVGSYILESVTYKDLGCVQEECVRRVRVEQLAGRVCT